ncbi:F-box protein skip23 [Rhynchospora pubera]|uniref:F-box protein skip23 n=1 Tax=Rhynchospora pubera TaxID=906938 RepID=A0AAV8D5U4_9POAL|nr:F-box protein skip23 [Rhynchospora pubera]
MGTQRFKEDWAGLPPELVTIIGEKVTTNTSYIRLRLACKAWRRALPSRPCHLPPQSPWLLLPRIFTEGDGDGSCDHSDELNFHDPFQSKTHRFRFPYIIRKRICASSHGWLVLEDDLRLSLFNPITQSVIDLPSFSTLLQFVPSSTEHPINRRFVTKAILSCNPSEDGCIVVSQFRMTKKWKLGFCRIGDTQWTGFLLSDLPNVPIDLFLHKNMVYTVNTETEVSVYDLQDLSVMKSSFKILHKGVYDRISFVDGDSESGQPFVIITSQDFKMKRFSMYKWFEDRQQWCRPDLAGLRGENKYDHLSFPGIKNSSAGTSYSCPNYNCLL